MYTSSNNGSLVRRKRIIPLAGWALVAALPTLIAGVTTNSIVEAKQASQIHDLENNQEMILNKARENRKTINLLRKKLNICKSLLYNIQS